jgi:hypothetical protein
VFPSAYKKGVLACLLATRHRPFLFVTARVFSANALPGMTPSYHVTNIVTFGEVAPIPAPGKPQCSLRHTTREVRCMPEFSHWQLQGLLRITTCPGTALSLVSCYCTEYDSPYSSRCGNPVLSLRLGNYLVWYFSCTTCKVVGQQFGVEYCPLPLNILSMPQQLLSEAYLGLVVPRQRFVYLLGLPRVRDMLSSPRLCHWGARRRLR